MLTILLNTPTRNGPIVSATPVSCLRPQRAENITGHEAGMSFRNNRIAALPQTVAELPKQSKWPQFIHIRAFWRGFDPAKHAKNIHTPKLECLI